tara:strand:+ start:221 stop:379 length:159 start_codon:yes stop_codon:yes gene_type:complete
MVMKDILAVEAVEVLEAMAKAVRVVKVAVAQAEVAVSQALPMHILILLYPLV